MRFRRRPPDADEPTAETVAQRRADEPVVEETEYAEPPRRPPPPLIWPWLVLLGLLVVGGIVAAFLLTRDHKHHATPSRATVPNVVGENAAVASERINGAGLTPRLRSRASSKPQGTVVGQDPHAGVSVKKGSIVTVLVSHLALVRVPDVVGRRRDDAIAALAARGLKFKVAPAQSTKPAGTVVSQKPKAGASVVKGAIVTVDVSKGVGTVPDVRGDSAPTAKQTLKTAGFVPNTVTVTSSKPKNTVVAQDPAPGKRIPKGSTVRINVSNGSGGTTTSATTTAPTTTAGTTTAPSTVRVPDVRGLDQTPAQRRIRSAGLAPVVVYVSSSQPAGRVVSQSPAGGTSVRHGAKVRLNVSSGPNPQPLKTVPNVVGQDQATATQTLQQAGFRVQVSPLDTTDASKDGIVIDEQPAGGSRAPGGALVTIYVGRFTG